MPKRNRLIVILLAPVSVILMGLGWLLFYTGFKEATPVKQAPRVQRKENEPSEEELQVLVIPPEQQYAT
jgi:hypothetical protein